MQGFLFLNFKMRKSSFTNKIKFVIFSFRINCVTQRGPYKKPGLTVCSITHKTIIINICLATCVENYQETYFSFHF